MAYALSHLHSLIRGSVGGLTYFANQFHQIVLRQRTAPVQPNTVWQVGVRTAFNAAEARWEALTQQQRQEWRDYAQTCVYPGPAGDYTVPGRQLFVGTLALALYADAVNPGNFLLSTLAPTIAGWFNPGAIYVGDYTGETFGIGLDMNLPAGRRAVSQIDVSIAFNLTRTRYKGPWVTGAKYFGLIPPGALTHVNIDRPAGTLGKAVFTRTRLFTGEQSPQPGIAHALAFPVHLRHIVTVPIGNGNNDSQGSNPSAIKLAGKKKVKTAA